MCGIAGILGLGVADMGSALTAMADTLRHRGPDAGGVWSDHGIGLAHRRLSILDLSPQGAQPMQSASGRFVLCYNGEVYNHAELRRALDATTPVNWRGHSDTEILVEAIDRWGVRGTLERSNGMFAFAVWDRQERRLTLARDRLGEKPLYIGQVGGRLVFASELKALRQAPGWRHAVDHEALGLLLRFGYVPAPWSIHPNVFKLPAATFISFSADEAVNDLGLGRFTARCESYWNLSEVAAAGIAEPFQGDADSAVDRLDALLTEAVRIRMEADVPVGAMLSGGLDSSLVVALMQRVSPRPVRTFTIGFREDRFDEARHAKRVAAHLGTDHTEFHLTPDHALEQIPRLPEVYDEPFADPSQLPTLLVSSIARQQVTVALSGDGGDELFFGYGRYRDALRTWRWAGRLPAPARLGLAAGLIRLGGALETARHDPRRLGFRLARLGERLDARDFDAYYANLLSFALRPTTRRGWPDRLPTARRSGLATELVGPSADPMVRMMFADQCLYMPEDILTKVDRVSMAASLEVRVPLLDPAVVAFAWQLPMPLKFDGRSGKVLLRRLLDRHVPRELVDRPKQGFEIPLNDWLRGPLKDWMRDLLDPARLRADGFLDADRISTLVTEQLAGRADHGYALWPALMFQAWQRRQR